MPAEPFTPGRAYLLCGAPEGFDALLLEFILAGGVQLLVLGNRFDIYAAAYALAAAAGGRYYELLQERIQMARAETAQQAVTLLGKAGGENLPVLVRDLLTPFQEEGLDKGEALELLERSLAQVERIARERVVVIHLRPSARQSEWFTRVQRICIPFPATGGKPMGHTKDTFTNRFQHELQHFTAMRRALLLSRDRRLFGEMLDKAAFHVPASEQASHPLPIISVLLAIDLEQEKALDTLATQMEQARQEVGALQAENRTLQAQLDAVQDDLEKRIQALRAELIEMRFPDYVS